MNTLTIKELLIEAKNIIATPDKWTKHRMAKTSEGRTTSPLSPNAVCFCTYGALDKAASTLKISMHDVDNAVEVLKEVMPKYMGIAIFNDADDTTHDMVLALFDKAIEELP